MRHRISHLLFRCRYRWVALEVVDRFISRVILQCSMCGAVEAVVKDERDYPGRHKDHSL